MAQIVQHNLLTELRKMAQGKPTGLSVEQIAKWVLRVLPEPRVGERENVEPRPRRASRRDDSVAFLERLYCLKDSRDSFAV